MKDEPAPFVPSDDSAIIALLSQWRARRDVHAQMAAVATVWGTLTVTEPPSIPDRNDLLATLVTQTLITPESKTAEGTLIQAVTIPWREILKLIHKDPSIMYQIDPW